MSYVIKAQHVSDSSTPKISHTVSDIAFKTRENRYEKAKSLAAELEALTEPGKTASIIALGGDKPTNYSFFATPIVSDVSADVPSSLSAFGESKTLDVAASDL